MSEIGSAIESDMVDDLAYEILEEDEEGAYAYLVESWLVSAVGALRDARRRAGFTQEDIAQRLGTKQPAIARLERDHEGRFTLRRFAEYALACDAIPLDIVLKPAKDLRRYALHSPEGPRSEKAYEAWRRGSVLASNNVIFTVSCSAPLTWTAEHCESFSELKKGWDVDTAIPRIPPRGGHINAFKPERAQARNAA